MNELISVGVILLLALLAGHIVKFLRIPEVTGYLLTGVVLGSSVLGWISESNLAALSVLSDVALGLILFSIGTVFELETLRAIGKKLGLVVLCEAALTCVLIAVAELVAGESWPRALLLGVMAIETAAASTLMVLRECNADGPLTRLLTGVFAVDNLLALLLFNIVVTAIQFTHNSGISAESLGASVFRIAWQFLGAIALGYVIGFILAAWSRRAVEHGEQLILLAGCVLLCVGTAKWLDVSALVANLAIGATVVNLSQSSRRLFESLTKTDPPLYAIFFVLAGANLEANKLASLGLAGAIYVGGRLVGKLAGSFLGVRIAGIGGMERKWLPPTMLAQAGLAVGLTLTLSRRLPEIGAQVTTIVLAAVIIFEVIGPLGVRLGITRGGESHAETEPADGILM